jgi:hypothetical protein
VFHIVTQALFYLRTDDPAFVPSSLQADVKGSFSHALEKGSYRLF